MPTRKKRVISLEVSGTRMTYSLYPSTQDEIKNVLKKMQEKAGKKSSKQLAVCESAFIAAGIERAQQSNTTSITPRHVIEGYNRGFRISMEHALFKCVPRSVLERTPELRTRSSVFDTLLTALEE